MIKPKEVSMTKILVFERKMAQRITSLIKVNKRMHRKQIIHKKQRTLFHLKVMIGNKKILILMRNMKSSSMRKGKQSSNKYKTFYEDPIKRRGIDTWNVIS